MDGQLYTRLLSLWFPFILQLFIARRLSSERVRPDDSLLRDAVFSTPRRTESIPLYRRDTVSRSRDLARSGDSESKGCPFWASRERQTKVDFHEHTLKIRWRVFVCD